MLSLDRFNSFIKQNALFEQDEGILLAVSGGRDSVLMAHLFSLTSYKFAIAHCNFNLREADADADEKFSSDLAFKFDVPFFSTRFDTKEYASTHHISIQMAARDLRYQWLEEIRNDFNFQYIALAHHQNDTIETMLLNLTRGTGIAGLHGILPKRDKLIRPLLFLNRNEIDEIVLTEGISYRDDSSNQSVKYARNKIRLEVIPKLKELNPNLEETFEANRRRFAELEVLLNERVLELQLALFIELNPDEYHIKLNALKKLNPLNTLLFGLFHPFGFNEAVLQDLIRSWDGQPGKIFESATHHLVLDRHYLLLSKKQSEQALTVSIFPDNDTVIWNNQEFYSRFVPADHFELQKKPNLAQLDADLLTFPLILRSWEKGDTFYPFGMRGKKKLSDFFTGHKISIKHKKLIGILQNGNGDILWISGYRTDDRYKVTPDTKKVFIFEQQASYGK